MSVRLRHLFLALLADGRSLGAAILAGCLAWLPEALWLPTLRAATGLHAKVAGRSRRWRERQLLHWLSVLPALRTYRPGGWRIETGVIGSEYLDTALAAGGGAILWVNRDAYAANLAGIIGLARAGYRVHQLTRPGHGFGESAFQRRWLNPLVLRVEARWLEGHLMLATGREVGAFRDLRSRLAANEIISIIALRGPARGHTVVEVEGESWRFPSGPVTLARQAGAPVLPVFVRRTRPGRFVITIEPPLPISGGAATAPFVAFAQAIRRHLPAERSWIVRPRPGKRPA